MKGTRIYLTILTIITVLCVIFGALYHVGNFFGRLSFLPSIHIGGVFGKSTSTATDIDEPVKDIEIDAAIFDLTITEGDKVSVSYEGNEELAPIVEQEKGTLKIKQKKNVNVKGFKEADCRLTLTIPQTGIKEIDISLDLGDLDLTDVNVGKLTIDANLGNVEGSRVNAKKLDIDANLGNVVFNAVDFEDLSVDADMGNVEIYSNTDLSDHEIDVNTDMGTVSYYGKSCGRDYSQAGKAGKISIDVDMGDIKLN